MVFALDVFGDRWSLLIVRDLMFKGRHRYSEFLEAGEGISTNVLADRLQRLVDAGILARRRDPEDRKRKLYDLTERGWDLGPILLEMIAWSGRHDPQSPVTPAFIQRIRSAPVSTLRGIRAEAEARAPALADED